MEGEERVNKEGMEEKELLFKKSRETPRSPTGEGGERW